MSVWYLQLLGDPRLTPLQGAPGEEIRFRYRDTWLLLVLLTLDQRQLHRDTLLHHLGLEPTAKGREKLRIRLHDLRHGAPARNGSSPRSGGLGPEYVHTEGDHVFLAPGVVRTDLQELDALLRRAVTLSLPERITSLKGGVALLRGPLLSGFEPAEASGSWLEAHRFQADRLATELWVQLAKALDAAGERHHAFDAARKAYCLAPETPETLELLLNLAEGAREREEVLLLTRQLGLEDLAGQLEELEKEGLPLTVSEEHALQEALKARFSQLSQRAGAALKTIALFPQDFTAHQASAIAHVDTPTLEGLVRIFPLKKRGERYCLTPTLQRALHALTTEDERTVFYQRHAQFFLSILSTQILLPTPNLDELQSEQTHFLQVLAWFQQFPPYSDGVACIHYLWHLLERFAPFREAILQAKDYLEASVESVPKYWGQVAAENLGKQALSQQAYGQALYWFLQVDERFCPHEAHVWFHILLSAHHAMEDAVFDHYATVVLQHPDLLPLWPEDRRTLYLASIHGLVADNQMARGHFTEAWEHNAMALALRQEAGFGEDSSPALWGQQASILRSLRRTTEAEACWDRALRAFEKQGNRGGMAECYRELGELLAESGRVGLGISLVQQAIPIFEAVGNPGAIAATQGILGDILLAQGQAAEAQALYEEGLRYWTAQNHPRWIAKFEARLIHYSETLGKMPTTTGE